MELDAVDGMRFVLEAHDLAFFGPGGDVEAIGQRLALHDQRVVAGRLEGVGYASKDAFAGVVDGRGFAVHQAIGADDLAAVDLADEEVALVQNKLNSRPRKCLTQPLAHSQPSRLRWPLESAFSLNLKDDLLGLTPLRRCAIYLG